MPANTSPARDDGATRIRQAESESPREFVTMAGIPPQGAACPSSPGFVGRVRPRQISFGETSLGRLARHGE